MALATMCGKGRKNMSGKNGMNINERKIKTCNFKYISKQKWQT